MHLFKITDYYLLLKMVTSTAITYERFDTYTLHDQSMKKYISQGKFDSNNNY